MGYRLTFNIASNVNDNHFVFKFQLVMAQEREKEDKYYRFLFYFDRTTKKLFVYDPNANRYTLNFANNWSYLIIAVLLVFMILCIVVGGSNRRYQ